MSYQDRALGEQILRYLLLGRNICGITFYAVPVLIINTNTFSDPASTFNNEVLIYIGDQNTWEITQQQSSHIKTTNTRNERGSIEDLAYFAASIRTVPIADVKLEEQFPHLHITFTNGTTLRIQGYDGAYECWEVTTGEFIVIATPDNGLAIWTPQDFTSDRN